MARRTKEWRKFFDFLHEVVGDSPHSGSDKTMTWFNDKMEELEELEEIIFENPEDRRGGGDVA